MFRGKGLKTLKSFSVGAAAQQKPLNGDGVPMALNRESSKKIYFNMPRLCNACGQRFAKIVKKEESRKAACSSVPLHNLLNHDAAHHSA